MTTARGERSERFPQTRHSVLQDARSADPALRARALEIIAATYWRPVFTYLRLRWRLPHEEARDLTQDVFTDVILRQRLAEYDPSRARFRTWLRLLVDGQAVNARKAASRLKRGGDSFTLSLDFARAEAELVLGSNAAGDPEELFHREWVRALFGGAVDDMRARCLTNGKATHFALFVRYDIEGPDAPVPPCYAALAAEYQLPVTQVTNYLAWSRRTFRALVLQRLRAASASDEEYRESARDVLGIHIPADDLV